jgi:peptidoglycan/xylan/chitin deacetylase (PgdA/CDA1 family)
MALDPITQRFLDGAGRKGPLLLMYHSIEATARQANWQWGISLDDFCEHLDLLQENDWTTILVNELATPKVWPPRTIAITFDDGYKDNLLAVEALAQRGMHATFFVVTGSLGRQSRWYESDTPAKPMLSLEDLESMLDAGMEVGSHTRSHAKLPGLSQAELREELEGSRTDLENTTGRPVESFAYPYGLHTAETITAVREAGYRTACSTVPGFHRNGEVHKLRRISVFNTDKAARLARKLAFADNEGDWSDIARYYLGRIKSKLS